MADWRSSGDARGDTTQVDEGQGGGDERVCGRTRNAASSIG